MKGNAGGKKMDNEGQEDEYNFFARELEKMGWGLGGVGTAEDEEAQNGGDVAAPNEFEGGPLAKEGWA